MAKGWSDASDTQSPQTDLLAQVASVHVDVKLHYTPGQVQPHTQLQLLGAFEVQLRGAPRSFHAVQEGQVVHEEAILLQRLGFELAIWAPSEWIEICRLRCTMRRGHGPRDAVTDTISHQATRLTLTLVRTALSRKLARSASPGLNLRCFTTASTRSLF